MGPSRNKTKRRRYSNDVRALIARVSQYMKEEYEFMKANNHDNCDLTPLAQVRKRTADAVGICEKTVCRIIKEDHTPANTQLDELSSKYTAPERKKKPKQVTLATFGTYNISPYMIRKAIYDYAAEKKSVVSGREICNILRNNCKYSGSITTLNPLIESSYFTWYKTDLQRKVLAEKHYVKIWRFRYSKQIKQHRDENRCIIYTGITQVHKNDQGLYQTVAFAGTKYGYLPNSTLIHKSKPDGETVNDMTRRIFSDWVTGKLLPNLPKDSVVVISHEPHNDQLLKMPTAFSKKEEIAQWLDDHNIPFGSQLHKLELYDIFRKNKDQFVIYKIDGMINDAGYTALRTPPKHTELNATESILGTISDNIDNLNIAEPKRDIIDKIIKGQIEEISADAWAKSCAVVEEIEKTYRTYFDIDYLANRNLHEEDDECESNKADSDSEEDDEEDYVAENENEELIDIKEEVIE